MKQSISKDDYIDLETSGSINSNILYVLTDSSKNLNSRTIEYSPTNSNLETAVLEVYNNLNTMIEKVDHLNLKMDQYLEIFETTITSDSGTFTKRVTGGTTQEVLVTFSAPFLVEPTTVNVTIDKATNYKGESMLGYMTKSVKSITKTSFICVLKNSHSKAQYYADCTVSWNAVADVTQ